MNQPLKLLMPLRVPELAPALGRIIVPRRLLDPWVPVDDIREELATRVLELGGEGRAAAAREGDGDSRARVLEITGRRAWAAAWDHAVEAHAVGPTPRPGITTAHILLGVLKHDTCAGGLILGKMGLDLNLAYKQTAFVLQYGRRQEEPAEPALWGGLPHTPQARTVLDLCVEEANLFSPTYSIGTEHLTLALLRVPEATGGRILRWFGITEDGVRRTRDELWDILRSFE